MRRCLSASDRNVPQPPESTRRGEHMYDLRGNGGCIIVKFCRRTTRKNIYDHHKQNTAKPNSPYAKAEIYEDVTPLEVEFCILSVKGKIKLVIKFTDMYGAEKEEFIAELKMNPNKILNLLLTKSPALRTLLN